MIRRIALIRRVLAGLVLLGCATGAAAAQGHPLSIDTFIGLDRVGEPALSPDGRWVVYTVTTTNLQANKRAQDLWLVSARGGTPRRISTDSIGGHSARWSPDGKTVAYIGARGGTPQVWRWTMATGATKRLTSLSTGADGVIWSPTGTMLAFVSDVYPDCGDDACNVRRAAADAARPSKARVYDELLFRHWNVWEDGLRSHLFVVPASGGVARDLLVGKDYDTPVPPFGGSADYAFSPDGKELAFTTKVGTDQAWRTNTDIYTVPTAGGEPVNVTAGMLGGDQTPAYSNDGTEMAFLSQERANFESDRIRLMVKDRASGQVHEVPRGLDRWVLEYAFAGHDFMAVIESEGRHELLHITAAGDVHHITDRSGDPSQLSSVVWHDTLMVAYVSDAADRTGQVYFWRVGGPKPVQLTHVNDQRLAGVTMHPVEDIAWVGAEGDTVHGFMLKPPQYQPGQKYPLLVLIHGGPQGAWLDQFHSRWNAQLFAAPGYAVFMPNPRGSTGYGQKFTDQISGDWGGKVYTDIMTGVDAAARLPYVDSTRMIAAGGSYGGYMIDWINGHTTRFKALVSHDGVYNLESEYDATEELWFPEWEYGGPYWVNRSAYERWSPHRFAQNFKTPTLVVQGSLDYRVPMAQGLGMFTALRRQGVPARLLNFPDEGHWVGKPANQRVWWNAIDEWFAHYITGPTP